MFVPVWFTHAWSTGEGDLLGAYLHCTATTPFETVCKQFINGSVPFGYSLNSGFDTGNDSWFSSGAWQVGTPVQKMPAGTGALWVGESTGGTQRCRLPLPVGSGSLKRRRRKKKKISLHSSKSGGGERSRWWGLSAPSSDVLSLTYSAKICMGGWSRSFQSWWCQTATSKGYHTDGIEQTPCLTKKEKTHNTARLHGLVENAFNAATVLLVFVFFHIWQLWTLRVIAQTWPFSRRGKWYLYVKIPELV